MVFTIRYNGDMTPQELDILVKRCRYYLRGLGMGVCEMEINANDFAHYCVEYCLLRPEVPLAGFLYRYRFIDFMREKFGRTVNGEPSSKQLASRNFKEFQKHCLRDQQAGTAEKNLDVMSAEKYLSCLTKYERLIYCLIHVYDFLQLDIARIMGVTEGRISQQMVEAQGKIKRRISCLK